MQEKILKLLEENARLTNRELSVMLGISESAAASAVDALEKSGVISGYRAIVNWEQVDKARVNAWIELKVSPKRDTGFDEVAQRIMEFDEVVSVYLMSGSYDLLVEINGYSLQDVAMFVAKQLSTIDGVLSTSTSFLLKKYKDKGTVLGGEEESDKRSMVL
ncbi:MAG: Lrp/AsnC family transcriptional regulator [Clostridia bacterium]|nr:Lrp/AsnC family transcriptional regulator [Clostridia bacterium]